MYLHHSGVIRAFISLKYHESVVRTTLWEMSLSTQVEILRVKCLPTSQRSQTPRCPWCGFVAVAVCNMFVLRAVALLCILDPFVKVVGGVSGMGGGAMKVFLTSRRGSRRVLTMSQQTNSERYLISPGPPSPPFTAPLTQSPPLNREVHSILYQWSQAGNTGAKTWMRQSAAKPQWDNRKIASFWPSALSTILMSQSQCRCVHTLPLLFPLDNLASEQPKLCKHVSDLIGTRPL